MSPKMNVLAQLAFELAYYDATEQHVSPYAKGTHPQRIQK